MKKYIAVALTLVLAFCALCPSVFADEVIKYGDVDFNGSVNSTDALKTLQSSVALIELTEQEAIAADVNADGAVNSSDALQILQFATAIIDKFPAEKDEEPNVPSTVDEILSFYKEVAAKNTDISTKQSFEVKKLEFVNVSKLTQATIKPLINQLVESNTTDIAGFPGDMQALSADDIESATYETNDDSTVTVVLNIKPQSDTLVGSKYEGSVGHAIGVVGDIPALIKDAGGEKYADISKAEGKIDYTNAVIKIVVDSSLQLVKNKCIWTYTATGGVEHVDVKYLTINLKDAGGNGVVDYKLAY